MSQRSNNSDTPQSLARDLMQLISWEAELGTAGYDPNLEAEIPKGPADPGHPGDAPIPTDPGRLGGEPAPALAIAASDAKEQLAALRREIGECTRCPLSKGRTHIVFGEGDPNARLVFVGEGPGRDEDLAGRPFVGAAGQLLDRIIGAMGLSREQVYICNVVKCRPPGNRTPAPEECDVCGQFVKQQIQIIAPDVVVALGATAAKYLLGIEASLGSMRARFHDLGRFKLMPTYHPAYVLRNPAGKRPVWEDMQQVMKRLGLTVPHRGR